MIKHRLPDTTTMLSGQTRMPPAVDPMAGRGNHLPSDTTFRNAIVASAIAAVSATGLVAAGWRVFEFDRALFVYAQALILSLTLTVYRFAIWVHRPPTCMLFRRAWQMLRQPASRPALVNHVARRGLGYFALNTFVWRRGLNRWAAHWPIMVGCLMALGIVLPLVFGWVWFQSDPSDLQSYRVMVLGNHVKTIPVDGTEAFLAFHGLVWASFPVVFGCSVATWRRWQDRGDRATQTIGNDFAPLIALLAIAVTGLLMAISYSFLGGWLHTPLATVHMLIVCGTLLWLPFSKLFHIPQRSLKLAHLVYEHEAALRARASCKRCGDEFASQQQIDDLIQVQNRLGYRYKLNGRDHYQTICPRCRRATLVVAHSKRWRTPNSAIPASLTG